MTGICTRDEKTNQELYSLMAPLGGIQQLQKTEPEGKQKPVCLYPLIYTLSLGFSLNLK